MKKDITILENYIHDKVLSDIEAKTADVSAVWGESKKNALMARLATMGVTYDDLRKHFGHDVDVSDPIIATAVEKRVSEPDFILIGDTKDIHIPDSHKVTLDVEKWVRDVAGIDDKAVVAYLSNLAKKHPEIFSNEAEVFRVIKEIKDNPTHFIPNIKPENALLVKRLDNRKIGKLVIQKNGIVDNIVTHATTSTKPNELSRLINRVEGSPTPSLPYGTTAHGVSTHSPDSGSIISQHSDKSQVNDFSLEDIAKAQDEALKENASKSQIEQIKELMGDNTQTTPTATLLEDLNTLLSHPRFNELMDMRKDVSAKESKYEQKLSQKGVMLGDGSASDPYRVIPNQYERNYNGDFSLTKSDIKAIQKGDITPELAEKIKQ